MRQLVYLRSAERDLRDIIDHLSEASGSVAIGEGFASALASQCEKLASLPGTLGRARPDLPASARSFTFKGYIIYFRYRPEIFEVINIVEGHRDILNHRSNEP